jgi:hypothetical protein
VKQGPNPYVVVADDIQKDEQEHDYHWQWYTRAGEIFGAGSLEKPLLIEGQQSNCSIGFVEPVEPEVSFRIVEGGNPRRPYELGLIRVHRRGGRVRYVAVAAAWEKRGPKPSFRKGPQVAGNRQAVSLVVESGPFRDMMIWQPADDAVARRTEETTCGQVRTDGLLTLVRTDRSERVVGYVLADGQRLSFAGQSLVHTEERASVSADGLRVFVTGGRRARRNQPPLEPKGEVRLLHPEAELSVDGTRVAPVMGSGDMALVEGTELSER